MDLAPARIDVGKLAYTVIYTLKAKPMSLSIEQFLDKELLQHESREKATMYKRLKMLFYMALVVLVVC